MGKKRDIRQNDSDRFKSSERLHGTVRGAGGIYSIIYLVSSFMVPHNAAHCSGVYSTSRALLPL